MLFKRWYQMDIYILKNFNIFIVGLLPLTSLAKKSLVELETDRLQIETQKALTFSKINIVESNILVKWKQRFRQCDLKFNCYIEALLII